MKRNQVIKKKAALRQPKNENVKSNITLLSDYFLNVILYTKVENKLI